MSVALPELPRSNKKPHPSQRAASRGGRAVRFIAVLVLIAVFGGLGALYFMAQWTSGFSPLGLLGAPVLVPSDSGGTLYMLTSQSKRLFQSARWAGSAREIRSDLYVDLWAFRAADATSLWRKRIYTDPEGNLNSPALLGADGNTLWLLLDEKLVAASAADGEIIAEPGRVEAENPELQGLMPVESRFYQFDSHGLRITAADARIWRVAGDTFKASLEPKEYTDVGGAHTPAYFVHAMTHVFQDRNLEIPGWWLGLLTDEEAVQFADNNWVDGLSAMTRRKLWRGREITETTSGGDRKKYVDLQVLAQSPEFLDGGLLSEYDSGQNTPILVQNPDSVLVLHKERLGDEAKLRLTRVAGPEGGVVWDATLPLTTLQSVMRGGDTLLLFGVEYTPHPDGKITDRTRDAPQRLVAVDLATGALHTHRHDAVSEHMEAVNVQKKL